MGQGLESLDGAMQSRYNPLQMERTHRGVSLDNVFYCKADVEIAIRRTFPVLQAQQFSELLQHIVSVLFGKSTILRIQKLDYVYNYDEPALPIVSIEDHSPFGDPVLDQVNV